MTYTEDGLVEQPAIALFSELGWETQTCWEELFGRELNKSDVKGDELELTFDREDCSDVVLPQRLLLVLTQSNPKEAASIIQEAIDEICRDRSAMSYWMSQSQRLKLKVTCPSLSTLQALILMR